MTKVDDTQQLRIYRHGHAPYRRMFTAPNNTKLYWANDVYWADGDQVLCGSHRSADASVLFRTEQELIDAGYVCYDY